MTWALDSAAPAYATHNVSSTTWNPFTINVGDGRILFVAVTVAQSPNVTFTLDKPGGETNDWTYLARFEPTGPGSSQHTRLFAIKTTMVWNHALTVTFSGAKVAKIANWVAFTGGSVVPRYEVDNDAGDVFLQPLNGPIPFPTTTGSGGGYADSETWAGQSEGRAGDLFIGFQTTGSGTTPPTLDPDTTNGSWVNAGNAAAAAVAGENIAMRMSYKIITGRGTQVLNSSPAANPIGGAIVIPEETFHVITQGGDIDSSTADPAWFFRTSASLGDVLRVPMKALDLLVGGTMHKNYNATITTPPGYTRQGTGKTDGTIAGTSTQVNAFIREADGSEGAKIVVGLGVGLGDGSMLRLRRGEDEGASSWITQTVFGADTTLTGTTIAITADAPLDLEPGDKVLYFLSLNNHDAATSVIISLPGMTFTQYDLAYNGFITDPDGGIQVGYCEVDAGSGSVTPGLTANYNSGGSAAPAAFVRVRSIFNPDDPIITDCEGAETSITITWTPGAIPPNYYEVVIDGGTPLNVGTDLSHEFTGLDPNTPHTFQVRGCTDGVCSDWSLADCQTCPTAPTGLTVINPTSTSLELCWEPT